MDADEAAALTAVLQPTPAPPHHHAFSSGRLGDRMITKGDQGPRHVSTRWPGRPDVEARLVTPRRPHDPQARSAV